ncbi:MAG: peptidoglycan-binding domain-containing protein, partial [Desulfuromonadaceae bacterium]|nr:peptidoglycan-binding domain-containing protein [Desulfuromonadaceae bacterium]
MKSLTRLDSSIETLRNIACQGGFVVRRRWGDKVKMTESARKGSSLYKTGSIGEEVRRIQERLRKSEIYRGPIDGLFCGGTEAAVKIFQGMEGLGIDGVVGPRTWKALFNEDCPSSSLAGRPLEYRCLALTGSFETGAALPDCFAGLSGDFDGQGISFGVLQWNFGQGSLQPLLKRMCSEYQETAEALFHQNYGELISALNGSRSVQMAFARSIQNPNRRTVNEPWRGMFKALGRSDEFQKIEVDAANALFNAARRLCSDYGLWSERGMALMFDIKSQNGSISSAVKARINSGFQGLPGSLSDEERELERLKIVANCRAEAAKARWVEDVRARKLCIANGGGKVHGI